MYRCILWLQQADAVWSMTDVPVFNGGRSGKVRRSGSQILCSSWFTQDSGMPDATCGMSGFCRHSWTSRWFRLVLLCLRTFQFIARCSRFSFWSGSRPSSLPRFTSLVPGTQKNGVVYWTQIRSLDLGHDSWILKHGLMRRGAASCLLWCTTSMLRVLIVQTQLSGLIGWETEVIIDKR